MVARRVFQVGEVSWMAGVSVRTLHYYEELGLLVPSGRTEAGYRLYGVDDLLRLQQIVIHRELGLPLEAIRRLLDDPEFDQREALLAQRRLLIARARATDRAIVAIDAALALLDPQEGVSVSVESLFDPSAHEDEVRERWGHTEQYRESQRRTAEYTAEDWAACKAESDAIEQEGARLMRAGVDPADPAAMDVAERHRLHMDRWFYPLAPKGHGALAAMYESDPRFSGRYESVAKGFAAWLVASIRASVARHGA